MSITIFYFFFFFQAEDGIRDRNVTGVQTCALPIYGCGAPGDRLAMHRAATVVVARLREKQQQPPGSTSRSNAPERATQRAGTSPPEIGRASCRERVENSEGDGVWKEKRRGGRW